MPSVCETAQYSFKMIIVDIYKKKRDRKSVSEYEVRDDFTSLSAFFKFKIQKNKYTKLIYISSYLFGGKKYFRPCIRLFIDLLQV